MVFRGFRGVRFGGSGFRGLGCGGLGIRAIRFGGLGLSFRPGTQLKSGTVSPCPLQAGFHGCR